MITPATESLALIQGNGPVPMGESESTETPNSAAVSFDLLLTSTLAAGRPQKLRMPDIWSSVTSDAFDKAFDPANGNPTNIDGFQTELSASVQGPDPKGKRADYDLISVSAGNAETLLPAAVELPLAVTGISVSGPEAGSNLDRLISDLIDDDTASPSSANGRAGLSDNKSFPYFAAEYSSRVTDDGLPLGPSMVVRPQASSSSECPDRGAPDSPRDTAAKLSTPMLWRGLLGREIESKDIVMAESVVYSFVDKGRSVSAPENVATLRHGIPVRLQNADQAFLFQKAGDWPSWPVNTADRSATNPTTPETAGNHTGQVRIPVVVSGGIPQFNSGPQQASIAPLLTALHWKEIRISQPARPVNVATPTEESVCPSVIADSVPNASLTNQESTPAERTIVRPPKLDGNIDISSGAPEKAHVSGEEPRSQVDSGDDTNPTHTASRVGVSPEKLEKSVRGSKPEVSRLSSDCPLLWTESDAAKLGLGPEKHLSNIKPLLHRDQIPQVRFVIPDTLRSSLTTGSQVVMLRIEPEQLGPAKLSLTMYDGRLRARVIVKDAQAMTAVERSLDRLVDQLSKANIEVDHIEVTIAGDGSRSDHFGRSATWRQRFADIAGFSAADSRDSSPPTVAVAVIPRAAHYVGAWGVNILA
ncbi:MAG TPA: flagellar hook-length control protein FliK [Candidatus Deferrimicrobium sp.]|nr:flagellar hook-length control protein FliK [Candidatus Deferrimicrobium sp.]